MERSGTLRVPQEEALPPGDKSGGGLELCSEQEDFVKYRGIGLGGMGASDG